MSTMLLGNIAYGKNDPIGKLCLGEKELQMNKRNKATEIEITFWYFVKRRLIR